MRRLNGLDALRGIAAFCVLARHLSQYSPLPSFSYHTYLPVDFFFMLSGYVMARTFEHRWTKGLSARSFIWARYKRFWPTMTIATLIALPMLPLIEVREGAADAVLGFLILPNFTSTHLFPLNVVEWSIEFELLANAAHALVLRRLDTQVLLAAATWLAVLLLMIVERFRTLDLGTDAQTFVPGLIRVLVPYIIGVVLYRLWRDQPPLKVPFIFTVCAIPFGCIWSGTGVADLAFVVVLCPLIVAGGLNLNAGKIGSVLGALSFPLYAVQMPVLASGHQLGLPWPVTLIAVLAISAAIAGSAYLVAPVRHFIQKRIPSLPYQLETGAVVGSETTGFDDPNEVKRVARE